MPARAERHSTANEAQNERVYNDYFESNLMEMHLPGWSAPGAPKGSAPRTMNVRKPSQSIPDKRGGVATLRYRKC